MLHLEALHAHYGRAHILQGVSFHVSQGSSLVLLGRNGAGKSTTLKSLIGLVRPTSGRITLAGQDIAGHEPHAIARAGLGYVPEDRRIFTELTVMENLEVGRLPPATAARPGHPSACSPSSPTSPPCATAPADA